MRRRPLLALGVAGAMLAASLPALAAPQQVTAADYARAQAFTYYHVAPLVDDTVRDVTWLDATRFWYVEHAAAGDHYLLMDARTGRVRPAFDVAALAAALDRVAGATRVDPAHPQVGDLRYLPDGGLELTRAGARYRCVLPAAAGATAGGGACGKVTLPHAPGPQVGGAAISPNGKYAVFVRDWNLWLRDLATGAERPLTTDGVKDDGYATGNAGWVHGKGAIVRWSPDSTKVATYRQDQRKVGDMYTLGTQVGHPVLHAWKEALVGDADVFMIEPVVIDVRSGHMVRLQMQPEERLSTLCDTLACGPDLHVWSDVKWAPDGTSLAFVTTSRDRKHEWFRIADAATGAVRSGFHFTAQDYYESGRGMVNWQYLPEANEAIWPSDRNDWDNLYLYSLRTGKELHPVTTGRGNVDAVLQLDRATRTLWFVGNARTPGINPYFKQFFMVDIDSGKTTLLTPEAADHDVAMSPDGRWFIDTYSTVSQPPVTVLRASADGHVVATLAKADITRLKAAGWVPPAVIRVKARDGKTTLYGLLFRPTHFDPHKKYPVVDYVYPGPQVGSVGSFGFEPARSDHQAMAELGFIVVAINGMGTPWRSASFHHMWYGNVADNTLPDQVAAIRQLAARHPWIDLSRVGIWGHSGGGNATAAAMFLYPDFFKVGWAESGNFDFRSYENDWGEKYQGLLVTGKDGATNYDSQALQRFAQHLKGHLMLVHSATDPNVPVGETYLVVDALIRANRDFDMLILPNALHGYGRDTPYVTQRRWNYFVRHLLGATPPRDFKLDLYP